MKNENYLSIIEYFEIGNNDSENDTISGKEYTDSVSENDSMRNDYSKLIITQENSSTTIKEYFIITF
jgi:hypothetical protein